jgi:hypothetical protein
MSSSKKIGLLKDFAAGVYLSFEDWRQPVSCVHSVMLVFSIKLCDLYSSALPPFPSLWFNSPPSPHLPCVNVYCMYLYSVRGEGYQVLLETNSA